MNADSEVIVCTGITKDYGRGHGVFDLDLTIRRGETFGFVGPNGAGKTTAIRVLMDLIRPDRGTATIFGLDARRDSLAIKRRVGYLPGELPQFPGVSAGYVIGLLAGLRGGADPARIMGWPSGSTSTSAPAMRRSRTATSRRFISCRRSCIPRTCSCSMSRHSASTRSCRKSSGRWSRSLSRPVAPYCCLPTFWPRSR